jgi:CBS domain-containing protein
VDEDGELAGIVSQRDLFHSGLMRALGHGKHAAARVRDMLPVKEVMSTEVATTTPDAPLKKAALLMFEKKIDESLASELPVRAARRRGAGRRRPPSRSIRYESGTGRSRRSAACRDPPRSYP